MDDDLASGRPSSEAQQAMATQAKITELWVYPVIGCAGVSVSSAELLPDAGFALCGTWAIIERASQETVVAYNDRTLTITPTFEDDGMYLVLTAPGMPDKLWLEQDFNEGLLEPVLLRERAQYGISDVCRRHPQGSYWIVSIRSARGPRVASPAPCVVLKARITHELRVRVTSTASLSTYSSKTWRTRL